MILQSYFTPQFNNKGLLKFSEKDTYTNKLVNEFDIDGIRIDQMGILDLETVNEMGYSVNKRLIAETMGKHSNLILVVPASNKSCFDPAYKNDLYSLSEFINMVRIKQPKA